MCSHTYRARLNCSSLFLATSAKTCLKILATLGPRFGSALQSVAECQVYLRHGVEDVEVGHPDAVQLVGLDDSVRAARVVVRVLEAGEPGVVPGHDDGGVEGEGHLHVVHVGLKSEFALVPTMPRSL